MIEVQLNKKKRVKKIGNKEIKGGKKASGALGSKNKDPLASYFRRSPGSAWDPVMFLFDRVNELLLRHFSVYCSESRFRDLLKCILVSRPGLELTFVGLKQDDILIVPLETIAYWAVRQMLKMPDGIDEVIDIPLLVRGPASTKSGLYNACLETMRTSKGQFFTASEIAKRVNYELVPRKRRLRQLRRLLSQVIQENEGKSYHDSRIRTVYGFR